jgi:bacillithiol biosynthesis cysteine-adding enzyme BshC
MAYKILTTIKLAEELTLLFPENKFVPVFWMASEDHDVEEIQSFSFFGNRYTLELKDKGAVGRITTDGLKTQMEAIKDFPSWMSSFFEDGQTISQASRKWLNHLFGEKGLLVLDADHPELKTLFGQILEKELKSNESEVLVLKQSQKMEELGFKAQIHPRNVNLFYLKGNERTRLERTENGFRTLEGQNEWTTDEALKHFSNHPEELSPNVCLRPLYSQILLPDVAFIGGPAEIAYWLQLKPVFEANQTPFPALIPRFSGLYVNEGQSKKIEKLGLTLQDLKEDEITLRKKLVKPEGEIELPRLEETYARLLNWAKNTDPTLVPVAMAELSKIENMIEGLQKRIQKAAEGKEEQKLKQLSQLWSKFFPEGGLQERTDGWLSYLANDPLWLEKVDDAIHPLDFRFQVMEEG